MSQVIILYSGTVLPAVPLITPVLLPSQPFAPTSLPERLLLTANFTPLGTPDPACKVTAFVQTRLGTGGFWDIASFEFGDTGETRIFNLSALSPVTTATVLTQQALPANTCVNGILGREYQAIVLATGTYPAGSGLEISAQFS